MSRQSGHEAGAMRIAESLLGRCPDRLEAFWPSVGGDDSHSFRLWSGTDGMLLKINRRPGSPIGVYFHCRLKGAGLPVPELVAFDPRGGLKGEACAIWEWVDGTPAEWGSGEPCPYDETELGELLRRIHDLRFDGAFGSLGDDLTSRSFAPLPDLGPVSDTWPGFFHCDRAARRYFDKGYLDRQQADILSSLPVRLVGILTPAEPRLLHMGDIMHNGNLILRDGRIVAIVDYVESTAGDPRWELACFDYYFTPSEREPISPFDLARFRAAYGTEHDPNDLLGRFYLLAILAFEKLLFYDPSTQRGRWAIRTLHDNLRVIGGRL